MPASSSTAPHRRALGHVAADQVREPTREPDVRGHFLGAEERYEGLPYFFTDQYDLGMEYVGYAAADADTSVVISGDPSCGSWRAYWVSGGVVAAGMHVNEWGAIDEIREQIGHPLT